VRLGRWDASDSHLLEEDLVVGLLLGLSLGPLLLTLKDGIWVEGQPSARHYTAFIEEEMHFLKGGMG
jgi:hypothetical protein